VSITVTQATPLITWAPPTAIAYGTHLSATQLDATSSVPGTFTYSPALGTELGVGTQTLSVTFTPTDTTDYTSATKSVSISVSKAVLTVTATSVSRPFGASNPALSYTVSGFVNGDTSSVVTGSASCSTTAVASSTGGTYPVTCSQGTLSATNYTFVEVPGTLTVTYTTGACLEGVYLGYTVWPGQSVCFGPHATIYLFLNVLSGGSVDLEGSTVNTLIFTLDANVVRSCSASIVGAVTIQSSTGLVDFGDGGSCGGSKVFGVTTLQSDTGGISVQGLNATGLLTLDLDSGAITVNGNTINGALTFQSNAGPITASSNKVSGPFTVASSTGGANVSNNATGFMTITLSRGGLNILSNLINGNLTVDFNTGVIIVSGNHATGLTIDPSGQ